MNDFLEDLKAWCIANPITKDDKLEAKNSIPGFWKGKKQNRSRIYQIVTPDGEVVTTNCLQQFCKDHSLAQSNMCNVANGKLKSHKGYKVLR